MDGAREGAAARKTIAARDRFSAMRWTERRGHQEIGTVGKEVGDAFGRKVAGPPGARIPGLKCPSGRAVEPGDLLGDPRDRHRVCLQAPQRARCEHAEQSGLAQRLEDGPSEPPFALCGFGVLSNDRFERSRSCEQRVVHADTGDSVVKVDQRAWPVVTIG